MPKSAEKSAGRMDISLVRMTCAPRVGQITATALMPVVSAADEHYMIVSDLCILLDHLCVGGMDGENIPDEEISAAMAIGAR